MLTHGPQDVLRHFQGVKHLARDQQLRLETPGWRVLGFEGNPSSESELERRKEFILRGLLVIQDREYPFAEGLIGDDSGAPDATLSVLAKVLSLIEVLQLSGPYELVHQLWSQFTLTASRVNINVTWSREEVLVGKFLFHVSTYPCSLACPCCVLVDYFKRIVPSHPLSCVQSGKDAWPVQHRVWWTRLRNLGAGVEMGKVHIPPCLCCGVEPIQRQYQPGGYNFGQKFGRCWCRYNFCVSAWRCTCAGRGFCKLSGKWVTCEARGVPQIWSPTVEALPPANCCICVWESGPIFDDRICDKPLEECRDSGLDGISPCFAQGHHHERSLHARPSRCVGEHCWGMAIGGVVPEKDWPRKRWR